MAIKIGMKPPHPGGFIKRSILPDNLSVTGAAEVLYQGSLALTDPHILRDGALRLLRMRFCDRKTDTYLMLRSARKGASRSICYESVSMTLGPYSS